MTNLIISIFLHSILLTSNIEYLDDLKRFICGGTLQCTRGQLKNECSATDKWAFRKEDALQQNQAECEAAFNLGGNPCHQGGFCCELGTAWCRAK